MRSTVLISRICRIIETVGTSGDGAALAEAYASAVSKVNSRLEAVIAAADSKSISDAIRLLSEEPPLIEEVSTLDFFQLQDWENLCDMNGWKIPPRIDKQMVERVVGIGETKDAIMPFLSQYKKAVRVNNVRLAVKSLRRLVDLDHSQDWARKLQQSERQLQTLIVEEFSAAKRDGLDDTCDRLAQELLDGVWKDGLSVKGVEDVKAYREQQEEKRRDTELRENIGILGKCLNGKWDRKLVLSLVRAIDGFVERAGAIPEEDMKVVDACRMRYASELEQEKLDKRWREVNEKLHVAIQGKDYKAVRVALSAPEFLDREPVGEMRGQAQVILDHVEAARHRNAFLIVVFSFLAVSVVLGVFGWRIKQKQFVNRCEDEVVKLAYWEKQVREHPRDAIDGMTAYLVRLQKDTPDVYNDPKVNQFETRLRILASEYNSRTNQLVIVLRELEEMQATSWTNGIDGATVTSRIDYVEGLLAKDDDVFRLRLLAVKNAWADTVEKKAAERRDRVLKVQAMRVSRLTELVSRLGVVSNRLTKELARADLKREVAECRTALEELKSIPGTYSEELVSRLSEAEKMFNEAIEKQRAYADTLEELSSAKDAEAILVARKDLIESFGNYREIHALKPLDVTVSDVRDVLSEEPSRVKSYLAVIKGSVSREVFSSFIKENILAITGFPTYYSLHGLIDKGGQQNQIVAVSEGKPVIDKPSYETAWRISCGDGVLLSFGEQGVVRDMRRRNGAHAVLMPSSDEMRTVVEIASRRDISVVVFENEILKLIKKHIVKGHEKDFLDNEEKYVTYFNPVRGWMSPFRRVQFLAWYMRWLKEDLKLMPNDRELNRWYDKLARLSKAVIVDGVGEPLSWICIWDDRVRKRTVECAKLLNKMPEDWVERYRDVKRKRKVFAVIEDWQVAYAGKVKFDPFDSVYEKNPEGIFVSVPGVMANHPLYVLRKIDGRTTLVRAFEPEKDNVSWRKCDQTAYAKEGYVLGEPLYHVYARGNGTFIDVQVELAKIAGNAGLGESDLEINRIPLFSNGGL